MVDAVHTWKIADPAAVELDVNQTRDLFGAGRYAFVMQHRYDESRYNNPELASASGQIRMGMIPGFDGTTRGTFGIVRMYGLADTLRDAVHPGVVGGPGQGAVPAAFPAELGHRGLADGDGARFAQSGDDGRVEVRHAVRVEVGPARGSYPLV